MGDWLAKLVAKLILMAGLYLGGKRTGQVETELEALKAMNETNDELLDAANRPAAEPDAVLGWLRNGGRGS